MLKHNKKKNTAIVYEQLLSLMSRLVVEGNKKEAYDILEIVKKYFNKNTNIGKEKILFESLLKSKNTNEENAKSILKECLLQAKNIPYAMLEKEKNSLIQEISKTLSSKLHDISLRNYKKLASIQILFNEERNSYRHTKPEERVKIKNILLKEMSFPLKEKKEKLEIDNFTYRILTDKFNKKYAKIMNETQKEILKGWTSFLIKENDDFRVLLSKKVKDIKNKISFYSKDSIFEKSEFKPMLKELRDKINYDFSNEVNEDSVYTIMRCYDLIEDLETVKKEGMLNG